MIANRLVPGRPPAMWLCLVVPLLILLSTLVIYKAPIASAIPDAVTEKLANTWQESVNTLSQYTGTAKEQIPSTIWRDGDHDEYLAVCLFVRDQAQDLPEWFQHHYNEMGIRRFYVMDDGSEPPMSHYMDKFGIPEEAVDFIYTTSKSTAPQNMQTTIYNECASVWGVNNTWIAYIDTDEFFDTPGDESIEDILRDFEKKRPDAGALGVNWATHTSNGLRYHAESVRKEFLECIYDDPDNNGAGSDSKHIKSIVRTDAYLTANNPHMFSLEEGFVVVGENGDMLDTLAFRQPITRDRISLHHYVVKSWEDYADKITRSAKTWDFWNHIEYDLPHQACAEMLKYFPSTVNKDGMWSK